MITKTVFGHPIDTGAITAAVPQTKDILYYNVSMQEKEIHFTYTLAPDDIVYGLGETMGRVNKRGGRYISFNTDTAEHEQSNPSLYASHNFLIVDGKEKFAAFFDTPARVTFAIDYKNSSQIRVLCHTRDLKSRVKPPMPWSAPC